MKRSDLLDRIEVKSPCSEIWDEMFGNDEIRFCSHCAKDVHNLSAMTRKTAAELITRSNGNICVRYEKDQSGKIINMPTKPTQIARRANFAARIIATSLAITSLTYAQTDQTPKNESVTQNDGREKKASNSDKAVGGMNGAITDPSGALIVNARVVLISKTNGESRETKSSDSGTYAFGKVPVDNYELKIESPGFKKALVTGLTVKEDEETRMSVMLEISEATTGILAIADLPPLETATPELSTIITQRQIIELPKSARNVADLLNLKPVITPTPQKKKKKK
jgi:hypothetical protein